MKVLPGIRALIFYVLAGYFFDRQNLVKARKWIDRSIANDPAQQSDVIGTDAILYVLEGRGSKAAERFSDCLAAMGTRSSANDEYLRILCGFWLKVLVEQGSPAELEDMTIRASDLEVDTRFRRRFRFPSRQAIQKNLGRTKSDSIKLAIDF